MFSFDHQVRQLAEEESCRAIGKYKTSLANMPAPGFGHGLHGRLLGVATLGVLAGVAPEAIAAEIRAAIPAGGRAVGHDEIRQAVTRAAMDAGQPLDPTALAFRNAKPRLRPELRDHLIAAGRDWTESRIAAVSPVPIPTGDAVRGHGALLLQSLYVLRDHLFIGRERDTAVRPVGEWLERSRQGEPLGPHVIPNGLSGREGRTKAGKPSFRSDDCVASFRFSVAEFDDLDRGAQLAFWAAIDLPLVALIDSGGKSIHAWIRVNRPDRTAWERDVEVGLYAERLIPLGVDGACRNEARLSRMPGFLRPETGRWQRLLYLAPLGRRVQA
jgi:hypothetical protein